MSTGQTRRRDEALLAAIRAATRAELSDHGYAGVTFEGVARRARTGKPVLYRRYTSRAHMVFDALSTIGTVPDSSGSAGSLRSDLLTALDALVDRFEQIGIATYRGLIAELDVDLFAAIEMDATAVLRPAIDRILADARARGELGPNPIPDRAAMAILALLRDELFFSANTIDRTAIAGILDDVYLPLVRHLSE